VEQDDEKQFGQLSIEQGETPAAAMRPDLPLRPKD
jgi:hypothetical protein